MVKTLRKLRLLAFINVSLLVIMKYYNIIFEDS